MLNQKGRFGNLPAGEVFLAPVEGTAEGVLVLEWGSQAKFKSPLTVTIKGGRVVSVDGDESDEVSWLESLLSAHPDNTNIAELGIGTNPAATRPDNVLESEKILGTVHVAFGDNHTFGGVVKAPLHHDFVLFDATLVAVWEEGGGRRVLLDEGKKGW
jgi:leucyl aminopeptidase (aminopeptidase T)